MDKKMLKRLCSCLIGCTLGAGLAAQPIGMQIDASRATCDIGKRHYGLFFEEINHAGDGGLYAELIHNRSFEDNVNNPDHWWTVGTGKMTLTSENLMNSVQGKALTVQFNAAGDGVKNEGFWGINMVNGRVYTCNFWVLSPSWSGTLTTALLNSEGAEIGKATVEVTASDKWTKYSTQITATGDDTKGWFSLTGSSAGSITVDMVSLFPPTYKNRPNGCRPDLAEMLEAANPSFVRFPGGCYIEGVWSSNKTNRFEWKNTIGPIEERPGHRNVNWNYRVSDGMGFHEMLQLTEDLGAEPLFVVNMGMGHGWYEPYNKIEEYIQEALDAIEYCNGDVTTTWGAKRAANGHPEPFNLRLIEIGNENYNFSSENNSDQSDHYAERYIQFYNAIKSRYPEMTVIGNVEAWGTDDPSWRNPYPVDAVDEHYYRSPDWFVSKYNKYDSYSRSSHKIYVGEYAVTQNFGEYGNLDAALGEAVYMLGMERNADVCIMNSYAPIFANENDYNWRPDMIRFNSSISYGTPSYYVQQLFPNNLGTQNLSYTETNITDEMQVGRVGFSTWETTVKFDNVRLTAADGTEVYSDDFTSSTGKWTIPTGGNWTVNDGAMVQGDQNMQGNICWLNVDGMSSYTYEVEATKISGAEGFLIAFNYLDDKNYAWWNLGGWKNTKHGVEVCTNGTKTTVAQCDGQIETGKTYQVKIVVEGTKVSCYLDGEIKHQFTLNVKQKVYTAVSLNKEEGMMYIKVVNPYADAQTMRIDVKNATVESGSLVLLSSASNKDENTTAEPYKVAPKESDLTTEADGLDYEVPAYSLNIIRLKVKDIQEDQTPDPEIPEPAVAYSFESGAAADDNGQFTGKLMGDACIVAMDDGNKALYTGMSGQNGWMDMGAEMARETAAKLTGNYTITTDILLTGVGSLKNNCWALSLANGTDQYIGLVNTANNTDWYYTLCENNKEYAHSGSGLSYGKWHTLTFVVEDGIGRFYVDGYKLSEGSYTSRPDRFADKLTMAALGHSPYEDDAFLSEAFIDNVNFYTTALTADQVKKLYEQAAQKAVSSEDMQKETDNGELTSLMKKFNYLHASTELPATTASGTAISWACDITEEGYVEFKTENGVQQLNVLQLPAAGSETVEVGKLTATLNYDDGQPKTIEHAVILAPDDDRYGYLYCFMNSTSEITNFALGSKEDKGHRFDVLLGGAEIFDTEEIAGIEHGTRDAYITRGQEGDGYLMTTTDMKNAVSHVWNNHGINLIKSSDLIHWESVTFDFNKGKQIFSDPDAVTGCYDTDEEYAKINRVWAPQVIWDPTVEKYLVYYSLLSTNEGDGYDKIYYSYADRDFKTLTQPRIFFDPGRSVIDADIVYNPYDGLYHMYYKKEGAAGTTRGIYETTSPKLVGGEWTDIVHVTNEGAEQVEGSSTIRRINEDKYNLYYMRYSGGSAYKYCETDHVGLNISGSANLEGTGNFQHGSFMTLTETEYHMLESWDKLMLFLPEIEAMAESSQNQILLDGIAEAKKALDFTTVEELAVELPKAYEVLLKAREDYLNDLFGNLGEGEVADLTFMLKNPQFAQGTYGWSGTSFTQVSAGVGEHFDKTFDTYQLLENMPAGEYVFSCQGFYRNGNSTTASEAYLNGTEQLLAKLYMNDEEAPFMSLYDETAYKFNPYTYPNGVSDANKAFNVYDRYMNNSVKCTLTEAADLKVGMRKTQETFQDWTCFDNFKLTFKPAKGVKVEQAECTELPDNVDVYTVSGHLVRSNVAYAKALNNLPEGVYILKAGQKNQKVIK